MSKTDNSIIVKLRDRFDYDTDTGAFLRRSSNGRRWSAGDRADKQGSGALKSYRILCVADQKILAHRAAWMWVHGVAPTGLIDHINGDKTDNRIVNLRDADSRINNENRRLASSRSRSGVLGVFSHQGKYRVRLTVNRKSVHVGVFDDVETARAAYVEAKRRLHQGCTL